jgi:nucleotide-binding universal stress UspA family protein
MHRVIIPVDFSETALSAARYTANMLAGKKDALAILYHFYEHEDDRDVVKSFMETLKNDLLVRGDTSVEYEIEMGGTLIDNLEKKANSRDATLIAMGITGKSAMQQALIGSNTLRMVDRKVCPVLIIPTSAVYSPIKKVAFASDFQNVKTSTPTQMINAVLEMFNPALHIINVSREPVDQHSAEIQSAKKEFSEMFQDYSPDFVFLTRDDFQHAIDQFVKENSIDLLLTIPRHQANDNSVFKASHTRKLAYHSQIPILAAHQ